MSFLIPPVPPDSGPPQHGRGQRTRAELTVNGHDATALGGIDGTLFTADDDALLRRLDANELLDIHQGLNWCDREMAALPLWCVAQRRRVAVLRRRWARRWRAATGRPAVSLQTHRAWQLAAVVGAGIALVGAMRGTNEQADPIAALPVALAPAVTPLPTVAAPPDPAPSASSAVTVTTPPDSTVTDAVAQSRARRVARELDRCRRVHGSFTACPGVTTPQPMPDVTLELSDISFRIDASSHSGSVFTIVQGPGARFRDCTSRGVRRCPASGRW
jgi:hypothetical protein